jgi:hypothetical protein
MTSDRATLYRIYFDTNEVLYHEDGTCRYDLGIPGSSRDIRPIAGELQDGMRVVIYMTGELEMEAILQFDRKFSRWLARPVEGTTKYFDGSTE